MKIKNAAKLLVFILIFLSFSTNIVYAGPITAAENIDSMPLSLLKNLDIKATSAILVDCEGGQILYNLKSNTKLHISTACKLMTVLIAIESGDISSNVTISKESVDAQGSALSLEAGEKYSLEELLYGIMLSSANDAANAVAEHISGDTTKFVAKMNEMASRLNMKDTHFTNPTGLYEDSQYTSAYDLSLLIKYAVNNPEFVKIFAVKAKPWSHQNGEVEILTSQNKLFWSYDGIDGGKIGYNKKESQSIIATAFRGNMKLVCVILDTPEDDLFKDATTVLDYGFNEYKKTALVHKNDILSFVEAEGKKINLIAIEDIYYVHPMGENFIKEYTTSKEIQLPLKTNKIAGCARYKLKDGTIINVNLYPESDLYPANDFISTAKNKLLENKDILILILFLALIEVILIIVKTIKLIKRKIGKINSK